MHSILATRTWALLQQVLAQTGWLRSELRRLDRAGFGHRRMRDLCDLLDALDSGIQWDLRDELPGLCSSRSPQAARIVTWLRADIASLEELVRRLGAECPGHPLVAAAVIAGSEICGRIEEVEGAVVSCAAPGPGPAWPPLTIAAEPAGIC